MQTCKYSLDLCSRAHPMKNLLGPYQGLLGSLGVSSLGKLSGNA